MEVKTRFSRRQFAKLGVAGIAALGVGGLFGCASGESVKSSASSSSASATQTITDLAGDTVEVPTKVETVADFWHAHNQIVIMLGAASKLVSTTASFKKMAWANVVFPGLKDVPANVDSDNNLNIEEILSLDPDVCFASNKDMVKTARDNGLVAVNVMFQNYENLRKNVQLTAQVLGDNAPDLAKSWESLLDENIEFVAHKMSSVSDADKVKVLHIVNGTNFLKIDGTDCIVDEWIKMAGGVNAIQKSGNMIEVSMEEIVAANPDVIIIGSANEKGVNELVADPAWSGIAAVKNGAVYANPRGVFPWDRYSGEEALQVLWAAKKLNPDKFEDVDMVAKTQAFYKTFYDYSLTEDEANMILNCVDPA